MSGSQVQPFYHLRPNKYIDRKLFVDALRTLGNMYPIRNYKYVGFGSYLFDDFKEIHGKVGISKMVSLENDESISKRAKFNRPYYCIKVINKDSSEYISELNIRKNTKNIFWLDYVSPKDLTSQLNDFSILLGKLNISDIIRITLNANPSSLGNPPSRPTKPYVDLRSFRFGEFKDRVSTENLPIDIDKSYMTSRKYPEALIAVLKKTSYNALSELDKQRFLFPLFCNVYADGQQMLTVTGIILNNNEQEREVKKCFQDKTYAECNWSKINTISVPEMSMKEQIDINRYIPSRSAKERISKKFPFIFPNNDSGEGMIDNYLKYYKVYPNFNHVSL